VRHLAPTVTALLLVVAAARGGDDDPWTAPLAAAGLAPGDVGLDPARWRDGGRLPIAAFDGLWDDWRAVGPWGERLGRQAIARPTLDGLCALTAEPLCGAPLADLAVAAVSTTTEPLVRALAHLQAWLGVPLDAAALARLEADLAPVPSRVRAAAAEVLAVVPAAVDACTGALAPWGDYPPAARDEALFLTSYGNDPGEAGIARLEALDLPRLLAAGAAVGAAVERAAAILDDLGPEGGEFAWSCDTPLGRIVLSGAGDDVHDGFRTLLLIDAGGDDVHRGGASTARGHVPVSVLIDAGGDDRYETRGDQAFAAGVLGVAVLADLAGDDVYRARGASLGFGALGVGLLLDVRGDDTYDVRHLGQGAATGGLGLLLDRAGDDRYTCLQRAQAFGQVRGAGLLVDVAGRDTYVAADDLVISPAPQTSAHNTSLAQGCGFGRRAHPGDERSLAGGLGLLVDGAGDDTYRCGVFGQGTAYWYALGFLVDLAGSDDYQGAYYVQAAAAHYAVCGLIDVAGDDRYAATMAQSIGHGHDLSIAVLHDQAGDDRYACPSHTLGSGLWSGIGVLRDDLGDDE
jgi:hypothetical protein